VSEGASAAGGSLPPIPEGFSLPFSYGALRNLEVLYLVDPGPVANYLAATGLVAASFGDRACVSYNFQNYIGEFPDFVSFVQEIELNITAFPETRCKTRRSKYISRPAMRPGTARCGNARR
jgi:hypothetical protein